MQNPLPRMTCLELAFARYLVWISGMTVAGNPRRAYVMWPFDTCGGWFVLLWSRRADMRRPLAAVLFSFSFALFGGEESSLSVCRPQKLYVAPI